MYAGITVVYTLAGLLKHELIVTFKNEQQSASFPTECELHVKP